MNVIEGDALPGGGEWSAPEAGVGLGPRFR